MIEKAVMYVALLIAVSSASAEQTYLTPGDMSDQDRTVMVETNLSYEQCLRKEGIAKLDEFADVRQAADAAMQSCDDSIAPLRTHFTERGFDPDFIRSLDHRVKSRSAKRFLPELMSAAAAR